MRRKFSRDIALTYRYRLIEDSSTTRVLQIEAFAKLRTRSVNTYHYPGQKLLFDLVNETVQQMKIPNMRKKDKIALQEANKAKGKTNNITSYIFLLDLTK